MNRIGMIALAFALGAPLAHADDYLSPTEERVRVSLGVVRTSSDTNLKLDSSAGVPGTPLNAEEQLGLEKVDYEAKFQVMVRGGERHRLRFDYFSLDRTGAATITEPTQFRDVVLEPGDPASSTLSIRALSITYEYSFLHSERYELAGTLGVTDTDLSARVRVTTQTRHVDQSEDQAGPCPTAGLDGTYVISKRWYVDGRASYIKVNIDDVNGSLGLFEVDAIYRLRPNVAFGLGYNLVKADVTSTQSNQAGYFNINVHGPEMFVRVAF